MKNFILIFTLCSASLPIEAFDEEHQERSGTASFDATQGCSGRSTITYNASALLIELANGFGQYHDLSPANQARAEHAHMKTMPLLCLHMNTSQISHTPSQLLPDSTQTRTMTVFMRAIFLQA